MLHMDDSLINFCMLIHIYFNAGYTDCIPYCHTRLPDGTSFSSIGVCACVVSFLKISLKKSYLQRASITGSLYNLF